MKRLGFSEHIPLPHDRWSHAHMDNEAFPEYIDKLRDHQTKEAPELQIFLGGEVEYLKEYHSFFHDEILASGKLEYLIGSPHWIKSHGEWVWPSELTDVRGLLLYSEYCVNLIESGLFLYMGHPDVIFSGYREWDKNAISLAKDIIEGSLAYGLPLEINANGLRKYSIESIDQIEDSLYPNYNFWKLAAEYPIQAVIGSDAHAPEMLGDKLDICKELAASLGISIIDPMGK